MKFRVASFNAENLFDRPKIFTLDDYADGDAALKAVGKFQKIIGKSTYSAADKTELLKLWKQIKDYVELVESHGKLMNSKKTKVTAGGRGDWFGFIRFKRRKFSDKTVKNTAKVIKEVNPDICCMVEVEDRPTLDRFAAERLVWQKGGKKQRFHHNMLIDGNDRRGIDVGVLSKFPIGGVWSHIDDKDGSSRIFSRDCPEIEIYLPNGDAVYVLPNHLKSKGYGSTAANNARRKGQTKQIAEILKGYDLKKDHVIVAGDMNDTPGSDPMKPLLGIPHLYDVLAWKFDDPAHRWTYNYRNKSSQIDYLLVSKPLHDALQDAGVERRGIFQVAKHTLSDEKHFSSITSFANSASDHGCVWADFDL